jgi:hypothetical protein
VVGTSVGSSLSTPVRIEPPEAEVVLAGETVFEDIVPEVDEVEPEEAVLDGDEVELEEAVLDEDEVETEAEVESPDELWYP